MPSKAVKDRNPSSPKSASSPRFEQTDGEISSTGSTIRMRRKALGKTLSEVSAASELTIGFISQVERNISSPSLSSLMAIAAALDTSIEELVRVKEDFREFIPRDRRQTYSIDNRHYERLGPGFPGALFYPLIVHRPPGQESEHMRHSGEVFCYLIAGEMEYHLDGEVYRMTAGDTIHHSTDKPHFSRVLGNAETTELWVSTTPSRAFASNLKIDSRHRFGPDPAVAVED